MKKLFLLVFVSLVISCTPDKKEIYDPTTDPNNPKCPEYVGYIEPHILGHSDNVVVKDGTAIIKDFEEYYVDVAIGVGLLTDDLHTKFEVMGYGFDFHLFDIGYVIYAPTEYYNKTYSPVVSIVNKTNTYTVIRFWYGSVYSYPNLGGGNKLDINDEISFTVYSKESNVDETTGYFYPIIGKHEVKLNTLRKIDNTLVGTGYYNYLTDTKYGTDPNTARIVYYPSDTKYLPETHTYNCSSDQTELYLISYPGQVFYEADNTKVDVKTSSWISSEVFLDPEAHRYGLPILWQGKAGIHCDYIKIKISKNSTNKSREGFIKLKMINSIGKNIFPNDGCLNFKIIQQ